MSEADKELLEYERYTDKLTEYTSELKRMANSNMVEQFSLMRNIPIEEVVASDIFYISDATEMLIPKYLGSLEDFGVISQANKRPIFSNRYVIPIKDVKGRVLNLVGYSKESSERYIYGTSKYYMRRNHMYGLENLKSAYDLGYAILTEGITDAIRLRSLGYKNSFANCGTHSSEFIMRQLNRCRYGVIKIPDRDKVGKKASDKWKCNRSVTLNVYIQFKDIDEMCRDNANIAWAKEYIDICIDWITSMEHRGLSNNHIEITMQ